jgi:hypothetical protein
VTLRADGCRGCGKETGRRGEVMVEVTVGRRLSEQWRGRGDTTWRAAEPALACRAGEPAVQARPEEREVGGHRSWRTRPRAGGGGSRPGADRWRKKGEEKEGKKKKEKREKKRKKRKGK